MAHRSRSISKPNISRLLSALIQIRQRKARFLFVVAACIAPNLPAQITATYNSVGVINVGSPNGTGLQYPTGVAVNGSGDLFIVDNNRSRVVEVTAAGVSNEVNIGTLNNEGLNHPDGIAVDSAGNIYVADYDNNRIVKVTPNGTASVINVGSPGGTPLLYPTDVAVDGAGDLYIVDYGNNRIVKVTAAGTATVVNVGSPGGKSLFNPYGVAVDSNGNLYIGDTGNGRVVELPVTGAATVLNLGSPGGIALNGPFGMATDQIGNLYFADYGNNRVVEVTTAGVVGVVNVGSPGGTALNYPINLTVDGGGNLYIADSANNRIVEVAAPAQNLGQAAVGGTGNPLTLSYTVSGYTGASYTPTFKMSYGVNMALGATTCSGGASPETCSVTATLQPKLPGSLHDAVQVLDSASGSVLAQTFLYGTGTSPLAVFQPGASSVLVTNTNPLFNDGKGLPIFQNVIADSIGNLYATDVFSNRLVEITPGGVVSDVNVGSPGGSPLNYPLGVAVDGAGNIYIADHNNRRIVKITAAGVSSVINVTGLTPAMAGPDGMAVDGSGDVYFLDPSNSRVVEISPSGTTRQINVTGLSQCPSVFCGLAVDGSNNIWIADNDNNQVLKVTQAGTSTVLNTAGLSPALKNPSGIAVDAAGDVYITDSGNNRLVEITAAGLPTILNTGLHYPTGLAIDGKGNRYIVDSSLFRIVEFSPVQQPISFSQTNVGSTSSDSPQSVTLENIGDQPLSIASLNAVTTGQTNSSFSLDGAATTCSSTAPLGPGSACDLGIEFMPKAAGTLAGTVSIADNSLNAVAPNNVQQVNVSGTGVGIAATIALSTSPATSVAYGTPITVTATLTGGNGTPTGSITYTVDGGSPFSATLSSGGTAQFTLPATLATGSHSILVSYEGDADYILASAPQGFTLTVTAAPTQTSLTSSTTNTSAGQSITLTSTVMSTTAGTPTGTVTFYDGLTSIGTATLTPSGVATLTTTTLPVGAATITASYSATGNYAASTSSPLTITVAAIPPGYTLSATPSSPTITQGQTGSIALQITPSGGYTGTITFACENLPANTTCAFSPGGAQLTGGNQSVSVTLTISTNVQQAALQFPTTPNPPDRGLRAVALSWPGSLLALCLFKRRRTALSKTLNATLWLVFLISLGSTLSGCSSGTGNSQKTPLGSKSVTVVATGTTASGTTTQSVNLDVTIVQ